MDSAGTSPDPRFNLFQKMTTSPPSPLAAHPPEDHLLAWNARTSPSTTARQPPSPGPPTHAYSRVLDVPAHPLDDHLLLWNAGTRRSTTSRHPASPASRTPAA